VEDDQETTTSPKRSRIRERRISVRKRLQMSRVQRAFLALTRWGSQLGIPYVLSFTPLEYSERLIAVVPTGCGQLNYVVEVFEEVMFSTHLVATGRIARYIRTVRALCRLTPNAAGEVKRSSR
jgi:hypothetical protein